MRTTAPKTRFAICVAAKREDDLIVGKAYQVLPDKSASDVGCVRVIDESGEDYLYPTSRFVMVAVPQPQRTRVLKAVNKRSA